MEGIRAGHGRVLIVEREFEGCRVEAELLAAAYEEVLPPVRREIVAGGDEGRKAVERRCRRATVGA